MTFTLPPSIFASFAPDLEQTMLMYPCQKFDPMQRRTQKTPRPANTRAGLSSNRTSESFLQGLGDKLRSQSAPAFIVAKIKLIKNGPSFQILLIEGNQKFCKAARFMFVIKVTIHHLQSIDKPESQFQVTIKSGDPSHNLDYKVVIWSL